MTDKPKRGRPPLPADQVAIVHTVRLAPAEWAVFKLLGGVRWLRRVLAGQVTPSMTRKKALFEAALLCSRYADNLREEKPDWASVAEVCATMIEELAESDVHSYPPGKPLTQAAS